MNTKINKPLTQNEPVGPDTEVLKAQFATRNIPMPADYEDLISIADCGRKALGLSPTQTPNVASGLALDTQGQLVIQPGKGMMVDTTGVGVAAGNGIIVDETITAKANRNQGLMVDGSGMSVVAGPGIVLGSSIALKVDPNRGLTVDEHGVGIRAGTGIEVGADVALKVNLNKGIMVNDSGVGAIAGSGITVGDNIAVQIAQNQGLNVVSGGVAVNYNDSTLQIVSNQLGVADRFVTKTGNSTITNGNLTFLSDDKGVMFYNDSRIANRTSTNMRWYKEKNGRGPQICDNSGANPSNIITEDYSLRKSLSRNLTQSSTSFAKIGTISAATLGAYAVLHITPYDTSGIYNYHQRLIVTLSSDGNVGYQGRAATMTVSNAYSSTSSYAIAEIRLGKESATNNTILYCYVTHTGSSMCLALDYSITEVSGITLEAFPVLTNNISSTLISLSARGNSTGTA